MTSFVFVASTVLSRFHVVGHLSVMILFDCDVPYEKKS